MRRRGRGGALGLGALAALAVVLLTWPASPRAGGFAVTLTVAVAVFWIVDRPEWALGSLAGLALSTMLLWAPLGSPRPWLTAALVVATLHALLPTPGDPRRAWARTGALAGGLALLTVFVGLWRPTRAMFVGEEGKIVAIVLMGAAATGLVLWATAETDERFVED